MQTRAVACFPDGQGFAIGSVEGRAAVQWVDPTKQASNFAFKCHRDGTTAYGINAIRFHPKFPGTFATAGSDGVVAFWDK
jgi:mRNA export factor